MKNLIISLSDIGLSEIESNIYLNLLKNGPSTVLEISKRTGLNRITVHVNCENLLKMGLLTSLRKGRRRFLIPENPENLKSILNAEELKLKRKQELLPNILTLLKEEILTTNSKSHFEVRTYEGKEAIGHLYEEILCSKEIRAYVNPIEIGQLYPDNFNKFYSAANNNETEIWDIYENNSLGKVMKESKESAKYHIKLLPKNVKIGSMDYLIHDNRITIIEGGESPVAVTVNSPSLYLNSKGIFQVMWSLL